MLRQALLAALISAFLISPQQGQAANFCLQVYSNQQLNRVQQVVLGDLRANFDKPVVRQCVGTCYFESALAAIESSLSLHYKKPVTISRPLLFARLQFLRLVMLSKAGDSMMGSATRQGGMTDVVSSGNALLMHLMLNKDSVKVLGPKSQKDVYLENQIIRQLHRLVSSELYDILHQDSVPAAESKLSSVQQKEAAQERFKNAVGKALGQTVEKMKHLLETAVYPKGKPSDVIRLKQKTKSLEFEGETSVLSAELEKEIIDHLSRGQELVLTYQHVPSYTETINGRPGFLHLPKDKKIHSLEDLEKNEKLGGPHGVALVDVIRSTEGRIRYLVVRNSWGTMGKSDHGYHYISVEYLKAYKGLIYFWEVTETTPVSESTVP